MGESKQDLHDALQDLHQALEDAKDLGAGEREELEGAVAQIRETLAATESDREADSFLRMLRDAIDRFEDRHPELTKVIGRVADLLSDLGI
ncbi:MAG: DUF4404 family protein [bacterium]|nr:DUF4404 family protein [bacterium]